MLDKLIINLLYQEAQYTPVGRVNVVIC